jgi:nucleoside-diphosphate-sugar epimerase
VSRINALGWHSTIPLREGLKRMYEDFLAHYETIRAES